MLNTMQSSIIRSLRKGHNVSWVTHRQAGKTYVAHYAAGLYNKVAYICPNWPMADRHKRNFIEHNGHITYLSTVHGTELAGSALKGYDLIVVDDYDFIPTWVWGYIMPEIGRTRILATATVWEHFMVARKEQDRFSDLNDRHGWLYRMHFDMLVP